MLKATGGLVGQRGVFDFRHHLPYALLAGLGVPPKQIDTIIGVVKAPCGQVDDSFGECNH